jgi:iron complex transport system substrate-binding protein
VLAAHSAALFAAVALAHAASAAPISVTDDSGAAITLAQPARRIVALAPHITEQLFAVGAGAQIVATTEFADYPPAAAQIPRVARAHSVDLERVAAARPDLIVIWGSGFAPAVIEALHRLRVPVYVNEPKSLDDIASSLERLAKLTGHSAASAAAEFRARVHALRTRYAGRRAVAVFYQVWTQPLMTLSDRHVIGEVIRLCGGRNVFGALAPLVPHINVEAVLAADPELIVTAEPDARPADALAQWRAYPQLRAVARGQLVTLDANRINRHTPRLLDEAERLCEHIGAARLEERSSVERPASGANDPTLDPRPR